MSLLEVFATTDNPPSHDLAFDSWLLQRAAAGVPCLGLHSWPQPVVVLGFSQDPQQVDLEYCRAKAIPVLRRITGGTGVVHRGDLAVSLALPRDHQWASNLIGLYSSFLDALEPALNAAGGRVQRVHNPQRASRVRSPICFEDLLADTLLVDSRKAVGCAQARRARSVLIHAAVLLGLDAALYASVFRVPEERILAGLAAAAPGARWEDVAEQVMNHLAEALQLQPSHLPRPAIPPVLLEPYRHPKWSPVPDGSLPVPPY